MRTTSRFVLDTDRRSLSTAGIFNTIQQPQDWDNLFGNLSLALNSSPHYTPLYELLESSTALQALAENEPEEDGYVNISQGDLSRLAVSCADQPSWQDEALPTAEELVDRLLRRPMSVSKYFGAT